MAATMKSFAVKEAGAAWSCDSHTESDYVITLYQLGSAAARALNPLILYAGPGLEQDPSLCHSRLPLPP